MPIDPLELAEIRRKQLEAAANLWPFQYVGSKQIKLTPASTHEPHYIYHRNAEGAVARVRTKRSLVYQQEATEQHQEALVNDIVHMQQIDHLAELNLSRQQDVSKQQKKQREHGLRLDEYKSFVEVCNELKKVAEYKLSEAKSPTQTMNSFKLSELFWNTLANDLNFRRSLTAKILGWVVGEDGTFIPLPQSVFGIDHRFFATIIKHLPCFLDGLEAINCEYYPTVLAREHFRQKAISFLNYSLQLFSTEASPQLPGELEPGNNLTGNILTFAPYSYYLSNQNEITLRELQLLTSLPEENVVAYLLDPNREESADFIRQIHELLNIFQLAEASLIACKALENTLIQWTERYCRNNCAILKKFFEQFAPLELDHLKSIVWIMLTLNSEGMDWFIDWLDFLNDRCLWDYFHQIYFKNATNIYFLAEMMQQPNRNNRVVAQISPSHQQSSSEGHVFFQLARATPTVRSLAELPVYETFAYHLLMFFAQQQPFIDLHVVSLESIQTCWKKLFSITHNYLHDPSKAQDLMRSWVNSLQRNDGLNLEPLCSPQTFFHGIEHLFQHAADNNCLVEQLQEMRALSLQDLSIAFKQGFKVISHEMHLQLNQIDPKSKLYPVLNRTELFLKIKKIDDLTDLPCMLFRYLSMQSLRESFSFYRELLPNTTNPLALIPVTLFIIMTTGEKYQSCLMPPKFIDTVNDFFRKYYPKEQNVNSILYNFIKKLNSLMKSKLTGTSTLLTVCFDKKIKLQQIPPIFTQRFATHELLSFVTWNIDLLKESAGWINHVGLDVWRLWHAMMQAKFAGQDDAYKQFCSLIATRYTNFTIVYLLEIMPVVSRLSAIYLSFAGLRADDAIFTQLSSFINQDKPLNLLLDAVTLGLQGLLRPAVKFSRQMVLCLQFIQSIDLNKLHLEYYQKNYPLLLDYVLQDPPSEYIDALLTLLDKLSISHLGPVDNSSSEDLRSATYSRDSEILPHDQVHCTEIDQTGSCGQAAGRLESNCKHSLNFERLLACYDRKEVRTFLTNHSDLSAFDIDNSLVLLHEYNIFNAWLEDCLRAEITLEAVLVIFANLTIPQITTLTEISAIVGLTHLPMLANSIMELSEIKKFLTKKELSTDDCKSLFVNPHQDWQTCFTEWQQSRPKRIYPPYVFVEQDIVRKIKEIQHVAATDAETLIPPSPLWEKKMYAAVRRFMDAMNGKVIWQHLGNDLTMHMLADEDLPLVRQQLVNSIRKPKNSAQKEDALILLLALSCHTHERIFNLQVYPEQVLCLLNTILHKNNLFHQLDTGCGKSLIAALHAIILQAEGQAVDILTENEKLALDGLLRFQPLYQTLGIPCASKVILAHSDYADYLAEGIHYTPVSQMNLFEMIMKLKLHSLPLKRAGIFDEGDEALTSPTLHNLAIVLQSSVHFNTLYRYLLAFVREEELFIHNACNDEETLHNFSEYVRAQESNELFLNFFTNLMQEPNAIRYIHEADYVNNLIEGEHEDFMTVVKEKNHKKVSYAAPIRDDGTKRVDALASFEGAIQPLLHLRGNEQAGLLYPYEHIDKTELVLSSVAKKCFDRYRLQGGHVIALSATVIEREEFSDCYGLRVFRYPTHYPKRDYQPSIICTANAHLQQQALLEELCAQTIPPYLIFAPSPKAVLKIVSYLKANLQNPDCLQSYLGHDNSGNYEANILARAGLPGIITVATLSLSRGAHIIVEGERLGDLDDRDDELTVINLCANISESQLIQMFGRTLRNGRGGRRLSILNAEELPKYSDDIEADFKYAQHLVSEQRQAERLRMRLLHDVRVHVVDKYFLNLRIKVNQILNAQYGLDTNLVSDSIFNLVLRDFNRDIEIEYRNLLQDKDILSAAEQQSFFAWVVQKQQDILSQWIPEERFVEFQALEPLVAWPPLQTLTNFNHLTKEQCLLISEPTTKIWQVLGHQRVRDLEEQYISYFYSYLDGQSSFRKSFMECLIAKELFIDDRLLVDEINAENVVKLSLVLVSIDAFILNLSHAKENYARFKAPYEKMRATLCLPLPDLNLPGEDKIAEINTYCERTKTQLENYSWDEITLPPHWDLFFEILNWCLSISQWLLKAGKPAAKLIYWYMQTQDPTLKNFNLDAAYLDAAYDILPLIIELIKLLIRTKDGFLHIEFGDFLKILKPILTNPIILQKIRSELDQLNIQERVTIIDVNKALDALPSVLSKLDEFRDKTLEMMLTFDAGYELFQAICQLEQIKDFLLWPPLKEILMRGQVIDREFARSFQASSLKDLYILLKALAHPVFFTYLNSLPEKTTFADLILWLQEEHSMRPEVQLFHAYQSNTERRAQEETTQLRTIKSLFTLILPDISAHLALLYTHQNPEVFQVTLSTKSHDYSKSAALLAVMIGAVILVNVFCFSPLALGLSLALLALSLSWIMKSTYDQCKLIDSQPDELRLPLCK